MIRWIAGQIRGRWSRSLALFAGILVASVGFTVLTGNTQTARLRTTGTVKANYHAAYDILVRPAGQRSDLEQRKGLVRPNYLSGLFGGITLAQYAAIRGVPGVDVAAPIAMIGYTAADVPTDADVTPSVDPTRTRQILRLRPTWRTDRGLTSLDDDSARYVYVTRRPVVWPVVSAGSASGYADGQHHTDLAARCGGSTLPPPLEVQEDGTPAPVCTDKPVRAGTTGLDQRDRTQIVVAQLLPDGTFDLGPTYPSGKHLVQNRLTVTVPWPMSLLLAAIDPDQESRLVGLDRAMVQGSLAALRNPSIDLPPNAVPVLAPNRPALDEDLDVRVDRLDRTRVTDAGYADLVNGLGTAPGTAVQQWDTDAAAAYTRQLSGLRAQLQVLIQSGGTRYTTAPDGSLQVERVPVNREAIWGNLTVSGLPVSWFSRDDGFRSLTRLTAPARQSGRQLAWATSVGVFDPGRLTSWSTLSAVPLETYQPAAADGADERSRRLLGDRSLGPNSNPANYLASPPMMLTSLDALPRLLANSPQLDAPVSAVRVRVADVHGLDPLSRERVRTVAERIASATGLEVDITIGASPAAQTVDLPAGAYGRPALRLHEGWSQKGVAAMLVTAIDRKSAVLLGLIVVVCVLFLVNAVSAAVRERRRELAVLACLGWPPRRLFTAIVGEVAVIGAAAGLVAAALAVPLSAVADVSTSATRTVLAVPVAVVISLLAAVVPALRAARTYPGAAVHAVTAQPRRTPTARRRSIAGLALANLARTPGRALLAGAALATAAAGTTMLVLIIRHFRGSVTGTLLGDAVSVQAAGTDVFAMAVIVVLGVASVLDVLYINLRERATELATLLAMGWSDATVARLIAYEGLGIGVTSAVLGTIAGQAAVSTFVGVRPSLAQTAAAATVTVAVALLLTGASTAVLGLGVRRTAIARILAGE